jgi:hypothetical protein
MSRRSLIPLVALLLSLGGVLAATPARADVPAPEPVAILADPILLGYTGPPPHGSPGGTPWIPLPYPTLTVSARLAREIVFRPGVPGETLIFSVGARPTAADPAGGIELCRGTTDDAGRVTCTGGKAATAVLLSTLSGGAWVAHPATASYAFSVERMPLVAQGCTTLC